MRAWFDIWYVLHAVTSMAHVDKYDLRIVMVFMYTICVSLCIFCKFQFLQELFLFH